MINLKRTLVATAVGATMLTPVAFAQTPAGSAQEEQHCQALNDLTRDQGERLRPEWIEQSRGIVQAGDEDRCLTYFDQANRALGSDGQDVDRDAAAQIVVTQPDPEVDVQQRAPLVSVTQQEPQVRVNQGQPEIIVRQAAPNVRVQVPQPIITIDMPQPEIIVRMPEPDVAVTNPEPQVEVRQQPPQVSVSQPEPQVSVQAEQATQGEGADVELQRQEAQVEVRSTGNAQIDVQRQDPSIQYEAAEPNIEVQQEGEPEIRFNQTGEPNIRFEEGRASGEDAAQRQNASGVNAQVDTERANQLLREDQPMEAGRALQYNVADLTGRELHNARGDELGTVDRVVNSANRQYLVLAEGGFLGFGEREVAIPLDSVSVMDGQLVMRGMTQQDIDAMPAFDSQNAEPIDGQVQIGTL
ncbi:PRC-barrel domain-containing protein [Devosia sp. CAU 1758]